MNRMISRHPWGGLADPDGHGPADVVILGLPYEGGACWRGGSAEAPRRLREISASSPAISETGFVIDAEMLRVIDAGDVIPDHAGSADDAARRRYFARVEETAAKTFRVAAPGGGDAFLMSLGGDHSVSIPLLSAFSGGYPEGYGLISLDAHPDLFETYEGSPLSNACPLRRAVDSSRLSPEHLLILGTRSYNRNELEFMQEKGIRFVPARDIDRDGVDAVIRLARQRMQGVGHIYLTVDIDVADPSCAPGTGAPVAGGLSGRQTIDLVRGLLEGLPVRSMDLVEIAPPLDPTDATLFLGLQIIFESFAVLAKRRRARC
jgi:agmatinase